MGDWSYKTDESGGPRRFLDHRESVSWAAMRVGKFAASPLAIGLIMLRLFYPEELSSGIILSVMGVALAFCAVAVAVIHLYIVLAGGIMGRNERQRYRERLREANR